MNDRFFCTCAAAVLAAVLASPALVVAQERPSFGLDQLFGQSDRPAPSRAAQGDDTDMVVQVERLQNQVRQLTGQVEQLQFRNQQLEQQVRRYESAGPQAQLPPQPPAQPGRPGAQALPPPSAPVVAGRRPDVFDPGQNPNAPGAPRALGSLPANGEPPVIMAEPPVGAPGGRTAGAPLDLSTPPANGPLPPPPARNPNATGAVAAVAPPSDIPKDYYDLAYGYVLRKDYAYAEDAFQTFLRKYPNDRLTPDAQFWLGESLFQRQKYDAAAEAFLAVSTKHAGHTKAADSLLRLGQSLAALKQKEMACATLAEVGRKYPRASNTVKQGVEREQKRVRC